MIINHHILYTLNNAGLFEPKFGSVMDKTKLQLSLSTVHFLIAFLLSTVHFLIAFLTQHLGLSIFDPNLLECAVRNKIQYLDTFWLPNKR